MCHVKIVRYCLLIRKESIGDGHKRLCLSDSVCKNDMYWPFLYMYDG